MTKLNLEIYDDILATLNKILALNDKGIELEIPEGSVLFENVLSLKLIKKHSDRYGITVHFKTIDPAGNVIISMVEEGSPQPNPILSDQTLQSTPQKNMQPSFKRILRMGLRFFPAKIKLPKIKLQKAPILIAFILVLIFYIAQSQRQATAKIIIASQPLTRSLTVKVKADSPTNPQTKILAGTAVTDTFDVTKEVQTTGEKTVGKKAEGKVKFFNKTDQDKSFDKGRIVTYDEGDTDYEFVIDEDITVPAATEDNTDPLNPVVIFGEAEVSATASQVGDSYNIDKNKTLGVDGYKKADFSAVVTEAFSGGKSEIKKTVADIDIKKVQTELDKAMVEQASSSLTRKVTSSQALIAQSIKTAAISETQSHKLGDETEKFAIVRTVQTQGLVYLKSELDKLLDELVKDLVPDGFVLSSKDRQVSVDVLGNTTNSVLLSNEADVQVTLKSFVVPDIAQDRIKSDLSGKSAAEAQKVLGSISNIKTYEFNLSRGLIPIFNKVPKDKNKIHVEIVTE